MFEEFDEGLQGEFPEERSALVYAIFENRREELWDWMKGKAFALTTLVHVERTFPDCVKLLNFDARTALAGAIAPSANKPPKLETKLPGGPYVSSEIFPVLNVLDMDEMKALARGIMPDDQTEILLGEDASAFRETPSLFFINEESARKFITMNAMLDTRFEQDGENEIMLQLALRRATERLFNLMQAYDLYSKNRDHLQRIFRTRRTFDTFGNEELHEVMSEILKFCGKRARFEFDFQALYDTMIFLQKDMDEGEPDSEEDWSDFERKCANVLRDNGFAVMDTRRTGDFCADIIAEKSELVYVVQCKWHGKPIGVSAVQEIVAARAHYVADYCAVVSRTRFTSAAAELARSNDVALLDIAKLSRLDSMFE